MSGNKSALLFDATQRLLRRKAYANIRRIIAKSHPADLAILLGRFDGEHRRKLFELLENDETRALVLAELDLEQQVAIVAELQVDQIVTIFNEMDQDDKADILGALREELANEILTRMSGEESLEMEGLLKYPDDSAGGIMTPEFIGLLETKTVEAAITYIRENRDVEMAFYVYVVNELGQLVGVISLRQLVVSSPDTVLRDIMEPAVVSVRVDADQEDVARLVSRYSFLAIPVTDDRNVLLGLVTVDDVIDVLKEEATEDILKMAGAGPEMMETTSVRGSVRARFPWLMISFIGELLGVFLMQPFGEALQAHHFLVFFMPIIMAMGGNLGTQSATIIVRGLATGQLIQGHFLRIYWREMRIAVLMGLIYGSFVGAVSFFLSGMELSYAISVGVSMFLAMAIAVSVGAMLPIFFSKVKIDPAVSTGPFITSAVDVLGLLVYFSVSSLLLSIM